MSFVEPFWFMPCEGWDHPRRAIAMSWLCGLEAGVGFDRCFNGEQRELWSQLPLKDNFGTEMPCLQR